MYKINNERRGFVNLNENLEKLNFTKLEAQIYLALLGAEPMSAYQLAKKIEMSRPSIYNALEHMLNKGMVEIIPDSTALYRPQEPSVILGKMEAEIVTSLKAAGKQLEEYKSLHREERTVNFRGYQTAIMKTKEIIRNAEREVYMNADFNLDCFREELMEIRQKDIRVIVFSFYQIKVPKEVEFYTHNRIMEKEHNPSRLMVTVDNKISLVVDGKGEQREWMGTITNNMLSSKIVSEHIHNDIYLLKLRNRYGKEMYQNNLLLGTEFEKRQEGE